MILHHKNRGILVLDFQEKIWYDMCQTTNRVFLRGRGNIIRECVLAAYVNICNTMDIIIFFFF